MNAIERLESLKGMLPSDKASILLVHGGLKPSALVVIQTEPFPASGEVVHIDPATLESLDILLSEMELSYEATFEIMDAWPEGAKQEVMRIFIAKTPEASHELKVAFDNINENHTLIGTLLGYPATAVAAFPTPEMLDLDDHPVSTPEVSEENMRLLGHRLSKANWREEVKYLEESGNYLKEVSPTIYQAAIDD